MMLTFADYHILRAMNRSLSHQQLLAEAGFTHLLVEETIDELRGKELIRVQVRKVMGSIHYELTQTGLASLHDYERANPTLISR